MRHSGFRAQFITFVLAKMADNIEHVISYWMVFQKFHSPALAGFAIVSHWLPFLLFSVAAGALADRFDPRRIIQIGMTLFIIASLSWSYFFVTDTLQMWQAMVILVIHGCAGVLWQTPNQMLLYDIVGPQDLESAVHSIEGEDFDFVYAIHNRAVRDPEVYTVSLLSGYKSNRTNWLPISPKSLS